MADLITLCNASVLHWISSIRVYSQSGNPLQPGLKCMSAIRVRNRKWHKDEYVWDIQNVNNNMMTSSNGNIFRVTGHLCGVLTVHRWIPHTKASDAELWCFFDLLLNKRVGKQWRGWWFEASSRPLWRHCNEEQLREHETWPGLWATVQLLL